MSSIQRAIALCAFVVCLASAPGCAAWQAHGGPKAVECAGTKLATRVALVVPVVLAAIAHEDWESKLAEVGRTVGFDVLACALQHVHLSVPAAQAKTSKALKGAP